MDPLGGDWQGIQGNNARKYVCGYCQSLVSSPLGWSSRAPGGGPEYGCVRVCPQCNRLTFFEEDEQTPGISPGSHVASLPASIAGLYEEARRAAGANAPTAAVLSCRKLLMHIAVDNGAPTGRNFTEYVEYLASQGYVPPNGKGWVDHIRKKSNEANHEIVLMPAEDAIELITFIEMLLKFIYEFPSRVPRLPRRATTP